MKTISTFLLVCFLSASLHSQSLQWAFNMAKPFSGFTPGAGYPMPSIRSITTDSKGNVLVTGVFWEYIDLDPGPDSAVFNAATHTGFVAKYSAQGEYLWGFALYNNSAYSNVIRCDIDDNVYVGGIFGKADFDPSPDTFILTSPQSWSMYIAKYSPSGQFIHAIGFGQGFDPLVEYNNPVDFQIDSLGNIYCTGLLLNRPMDFDPSGDSLILQSQSGNEEIFIAKYTKDLSLVWAKRIGSNGTSGYQWVQSLALDESGKFYIGGFFANDSVDFDPSPNSSYYLSAYGNPHRMVAFLAQYDTSSAFRWVRKMEGTKDCSTYSLSICHNGDVLASGFFNQWIDITPSATTSTFLYSEGGTSKANSFLARFTSTGDVMWGTAMACRDWVYVSASEDVSGNIITAGEFKDTLYPYGINQSPYIVPEVWNIYIATYSPVGQILCIQSVGADSSFFDVSAVLAHQGSVLVSGSFRGNVDFNPGAGTHFLNSATGQAFLAKYTLNTGIETSIHPSINYLVFPNPTTDYLTLQSKDNTPLFHGKLQIFNMQGGLQMEFIIPKHQNQLQLNLSSLPPGLYLGRMHSSEVEAEVFRFVKKL